MKQEKSCGGLVLCKRDDKVMLLLIRHKKGGHWSFPKGHVENNETERQTALREIREETGLTVEIKDGYRERVVYNPRPDIKKEVVYFLATSDWVQPTPQEAEISQAIWVDLHKAIYRVSYWNDKRLIRRAVKKLKKDGESFFSS